MTWHTTDDVDEFLATAGAFLSAQPVESTLLLTIAETLRVRGGTAYGQAHPLLGWWRPAASGVASAFLHTPPYPAVLAPAPSEAVAALAATLAAVDYRLPAINATDDDATAFAREWCRLTGASAELTRHTRLYRLDQLTVPAVPGKARVATAADRDLMLAWFAAFGLDVGEDLANPEAVVDDRISFGGLTLWEVDGAPVALGGVNRTLAGVARVGPIYTPTALRQRGYGGAVTAAVSQAALDAGAADVVLFTDLANPTSNALYQRLGYHPVHERSVLSFTT